MADDTPMSALPEGDGKLCKRLKSYARDQRKLAAGIADGASLVVADAKLTAGQFSAAAEDYDLAATRIETLSREIERLQAGDEQSLDEIRLPEPPRRTIGKVMSEEALAERDAKTRAETLEEAAKEAERFARKDWESYDPHTIAKSIRSLGQDR